MSVPQVSCLGDRMPFIRRLMDEGVIPPMTTSFSLHFPLNGIIRVSYECHAHEDLLTEGVAAEITNDIKAGGKCPDG